MRLRVICCRTGTNLFYSFFKTLIGKELIVELKNDLQIKGTLYSVDQFLNIKLKDITVIESHKYPHMLSVKHCFIRGSVVRYVQIPAKDVLTDVLHDSCRLEIKESKNKIKQ